MPKQKHDYETLRSQFMSSKFTDVKSFILDKWLTYNAAIRMNAKWWAKEKREIKARAADKAIARVENKLVERLEPSSEVLLWNINKAIELTWRKLEQMEEKDNINVKDLNTIWSMNRIQNWQPTTYVKEEQQVDQRVILTWIHIVLWKKPTDDENDVEETI